MLAKYTRALLALAVVLAFYARAKNYAEALDLAHHRVIVDDNDAPYHMLRATDFAEGKTDRIQFLDERTYAPTGYVCHWAPGFDFLLGVAGRAFFAVWPDHLALQAFLSFLIPLLGAATIALFFLLARQILPPGPSLVAAFLFSMVPYHITATYFGVVGHHVVEFLFIVLLYWAWLRMEGRAGAAVLAAVIVAGYWIVPGFLLDYLVFGAAAAGALTLGRAWRDAAPRAHRLAQANVAALLVLAASVPLSYYGSRGAVRFDSLSWLHVTLVAFGAIWSGALAFVTRRPDSPRRLAASFAVAIAATVGLAAVVPGFLATVTEGFLFTQGNAHIRQANEIKPLDWAALTVGMLGVFWPIAVVGTAVVAWSAVKRRDLRLASLVVPTVIYAAMAIQERKFYRYDTIFGVLLGVAGVATLLQLRPWPRRARWALAASGLGLTLFALRTYDRLLLLGTDLAVKPAYQLVSFIGDHFTRGHPGISVLAPWDLGHKLILYTDFFNVDNPFIMRQFEDRTRDMAAFTFAPSADAALAILHRYQAALVVLESPLEQASSWPLLGPEQAAVLTADAFGPRFQASVGASLFLRDGMPPAAAAADACAALGSFRLVYESALARRTLDATRPYYLLYEAVKGAVLRGRGLAPGAHVAVDLPLRTVIGRAFVFHTCGVADADGRFAVTVPYAAPAANYGTTADAPYHVTSEGHAVDVAVPDEAVAVGGEVPVRL